MVKMRAVLIILNRNILQLCIAGIAMTYHQGMPCYSAEVAVENGRVPIAVLGFKGLGVDSRDARLFCKKIQNRLVDEDCFDVVERSQTPSILKEKALQQTGSIAKDSSVKESQLTGVRYMVTGTLSQTGAILSATLRVIDVQTGTTESSVTRDTYGGIEKGHALIEALTVGLKATLCSPTGAIDRNGIGPDESTPGGGWDVNITSHGIIINDRLYQFPIAETILRQRFGDGRYVDVSGKWRIYDSAGVKFRISAGAATTMFLYLSVKGAKEYEPCHAYAGVVRIEDKTVSQVASEAEYMMIQFEGKTYWEQSIYKNISLGMLNILVDYDDETWRYTHMIVSE